MRQLGAVGVGALGLLLSLGGHAYADEIKTVPVHFKHGTSSAIMSGHIGGYNSIDYVLGAKAGQQMSVTLQTKSSANYFNVLPPGSNDEAIFIGSTAGGAFSGTLPKDGDYKIRVYLMRSAARRGEKADFTLKMAITGDAAAQALPNDDASPRASGQIPCAAEAGQPMGQCDFVVTREGAGTATVMVTKQDGSKRGLFFKGGKFSGADLSQADGDLKTGSSRESDLNMIRVGTERYEIVDAVIFGG